MASRILPASRRRARTSPSRRGGCGWSAAVAVFLVVGLVIALVVVNSSQAGHGRCAAADAGALDLTTPNAFADDVAAAASPGRPGADAERHPAQRVGEPRRDRVGALRSHRNRQGHQHHLRRHRQRAADGVQRRCCRGARQVDLPSPAEDSASLTIINVGSAGVLLGHGQRRPGAVEHRQRPDDLHRRRASAPEPGAAREPAPSSPCPRPAPAPDHRCLPGPCRTSR